MAALTLGSRLPASGPHLAGRVRPLPQTVPTGVAAVDAIIGGLPRGCLTEIFGPASSGRSSGTPLVGGIGVRVVRRKPGRAVTASFYAAALK